MKNSIRKQIKFNDDTVIIGDVYNITDKSIDIRTMKNNKDVFLIKDVKDILSITSISERYKMCIC